MPNHAGETLVQLTTEITSPEGTKYEARACGAPMSDGSWQGWIEFVPIHGGVPVRTPRETTQPNRTDTQYWGTGLTPVYLEGALARALRKPGAPAEVPIARSSIFEAPAPFTASIGTRESLINPFSVYEHGEAHLRKQLSAFAAWHLVNIAREFELTDLDVDTLNHMRSAELVELIANAVRDGVESPHASFRR
jgi:hypothetical protein